MFIGAITFTGSVIAWAKLDGKIGSRPLLMPGRHALNLILVLTCVVLTGFAKPVRTTQVNTRIKFRACRPGINRGRLPIFPSSLAQAITDPVKVMAPMNTPMKTSTRCT